MHPLPRKTPEAEPYWQGMDKNELRYQFCLDCSQPVFHPRHLCPYCMSSRLEWRVSSGKAKIYTYSVVYRPLFPDWKAPYILAIVKLDEDYYLSTQIVDCFPEQVRVDMPVEITFERVSPDLVLPKFRPRNERQVVN